MVYDDSFEQLKYWIEDNVGKRFKLVDDGVFNTYLDANRQLRRMEVAPSNNHENLNIALRNYISMYQSYTSEVAQVEFSDDFKSFKIYRNGNNFFS